MTAPLPRQGTAPHLPHRSASAGLVPGPVLDHREAKARVLCVLGSGDPLVAGKAALDTLTARNRELLNGGPDAIRSALADQVAILEQVVSAYTIAAVRERRADDRKALQTVALRASGVLMQALVALHRVTEDQRNGNALPA